jgi:hypothetical protein
VEVPLLLLLVPHRNEVRSALVVFGDESCLETGWHTSEQKAQMSGHGAV